MCSPLGYLALQTLEIVHYCNHCGMAAVIDFATRFAICYFIDEVNWSCPCPCPPGKCRVKGDILQAL